MTVWQNEAGVTVSWTDGARAKFTDAVTLTVSGGRTASGIDLGASVTISGDAITFAESSTIVYQKDATLRFENEINAGSGVTFENREQVDVVYTSELEGNLGEDDTLLFRNLKLSDVDTIVATLHCQFGSASKEYTINSSLPNRDTGGKDGDYGCFFLEKGENEWTCQFQGVHYGGRCLNGIKVRLHQVGDDIYGQRIWKKSAYKKSSEWFGKDLEAVGSGDSYDEWIFGFELRKTDEVPTLGRTEFAGGYNANGVETVVNDGTLAFVGEQILNCNLRAQNGGSVEIAANALVTVPDANNCRLYGGAFYVYGTMDVGVGSSSGNYHFFSSANNGFYVCNGGRLICRKVWPPYGYDQCAITVFEGGVLETAGESAIGCNYNRVYVAGGRWYQGYDYKELPNSSPMALMEIVMTNGGVIDGYIGSMGYDYYNREYKIEVTDGNPCAINLEVIRMGTANKAVNSSGSRLQSIFDIRDVTGDAASDLVVSSVFKEAVGMSVESGAETNFYFRKTGAGTLCLTGVGSSVPHCQFQLAAGSVNIGSSASATFGTFSLTGDAAFEVEEGGSIAFADSSAIEWTAGKMLTLKSKVGKTSLRFGESAAGLTADQLAAICYDASVTTKKPVFSLTSSGYLTDGLSGGFCIRIR